MSDAHPRRILLVEDEPLIRMIAADMLDVLGFAVVEAGNAAEALAVDDETLRGVAGVMIDLGLPDERGDEVARRLRQRRPDLPVVFASGADVSPAETALPGDGPVGVLEKPFQFNDMQRAIGLLPAPAPGVA